MMNMTPTDETRHLGPIAEYLALSRAIEALVWRGIYTRINTASIPVACAACGIMYARAQDTPWFHRLMEELKTLGYSISADGVMTW